MDMRFGSLIGLKPEFEERYIILHKHTFPGVLDRIHRSNIRNYSIFLKDGLLFSYFEYIGNDYEEDMARIGQDVVTQDWWKLTDPMQEPLETRKEGEWWTSMDEIFYREYTQREKNEVQRKAFIASIRGVFRKNTFPIPQIQESNSRNIRKCSIYHKDSSLYCYLECIGRNISEDSERFLKGLDVERRLQWIPMEEVFHTD
jgi:L-rhamnose mutarotase